MENFDEMTEMAAMRQEMASLRERLDAQMIISEDHIRRSMKDNVMKIKTGVVLLCILATAAMAYCYWLFEDILGLSLVFTIFTLVYLAAAVAFSIWSVSKLKPSDMMGENLSSAGRELALMKKRGNAWKRVAFITVAIWFVWFVIEVVNSGQDSETVYSLLAGCGFGLLAGLVCGFIYDRRQTAMINGMLRQIDELTK